MRDVQTKFSASIYFHQKDIVIVSPTQVALLLTTTEYLSRTSIQALTGLTKEMVKTSQKPLKPFRCFFFGRKKLFLSIFT